jgi:hypothetical protein
MSTYFDDLLNPLGYTQLAIGITGAGFQAFIFCGSALFSDYVDKSGNFYNT